MKEYKPSIYTAHERFIDSLRNAVLTSQRSYKDIASECKVAGSTIGNVASGKTRWPRYTTLFPLAEAMGKRIVLMDK